MSVVGFDEDTMRTYARIRGTLRSQGNLIGEGDLLIAAAAIRNGLILVTRNLRDFRRVAGLQLYGTS